jgi:hypothetical protein
VRTAGLEPAQGYPQGILSPLRLPFRHVRGANKTEQSITKKIKSLATNERKLGAA